MKRTLSILLAIVLCLSVCNAQPHRYYHPERIRHHHNSGWENFDRTLHTIDNIASTAMLFASIHAIDSYTGIRAGVNTASLKLYGNIEDCAESEYLGGMNFGVVFGWYIGKSPVIIEPGVFISGKGGEISSREYSTSKNRMTTLEIPVVFKYDISHGGNVGLQPFAGGFLGFGIGGDTKYRGDHERYDTFSSDGFKSFDAGLRVGCGLGLGHFYMELVADYGLVNLAASGYRDYGYDDWNDEINSRCVSFNVGLNF